MNGFNLHAALQFAVGNLNQVIQQVQQQLQNINATINIKLPTNISGQLTQLNTGIQTLNNNLTALTRVTTQSSASTSQLNTTLQQAQQTFNNTSSAAQRTTQSISGSKDAMEEFGRVAGITARRFAGFVLVANSVSEAFRGVSVAFKSALDFEREFVKLSQVGEAYRSDLQALRAEIDRLAKSFGSSSQDLLNSAVTLRQAGLNVREVTQALEALSKASLSPSFDDMKSTTEGLISIMAQFRLQAKDMEGALSSINTVANAYAVESRDILEAVRRTGGAFRSVGGDLNEFIALFTSVRATTRESAESIATGLKTIFARIQRNDAVESLKEFGINLRYTREEAVALGNVNLERQFVGGYEAIQRLSSAMRNIPTTDPRYARIIEDLGGYRQLSKVIPLIQETAIQQQALNMAQASGNSLTVSAEQAQTNFLVKIQKIKEEFLALGRTLMNSQGFQTFLDSFVKMGNAAVSLLDKLSPLIPMFTALAAIKFASNLGSFVTGFGEGIRGNGPRRYATGGEVAGFGSGDTVPAMLSPGEHVLTRQQVARMGGHSNVQKFASGGRRFAFGNRTVSEEEILAFQAFHAQEGLNPTGFQTMDKGLDAQSRNMLAQYGMDISLRKGFKQRYLDLKAYEELRRKAGKSNVADGTLLLPFEGHDLSIITTGLSYGSQAGPFSSGATNTTLKSLNEFTKNAEVKQLFDSLGIKKIQASVNARPVSSDLTEQFVKQIASHNLPTLDEKQHNSIAGQLFESSLGFKVRSSQDRLDLLDVPDHLKEQIFGNFSGNIFADLKYSQNSGAINDAARKYIGHLIQTGQFSKLVQSQRMGFARGGIVPGQGNFDTVPADLEPGSFVIKKDSVESIGRENLARMAYAQGGLVLSRHKIGQLAAHQKGGIESPTSVRGDSYPDVKKFIAGRLIPENKIAAPLVASRFEFNAPFSTHILENERLKKALEPSSINAIFDAANKVIGGAFPGRSYKTNLGSDTRARETLAGYVFEGMISAMSNIENQGGLEPLDFIFDNKNKSKRLDKYFSGNPGDLDFADAKRSSVAGSLILGKFVRAAFSGRINALTDDTRFNPANLNSLAQEEIKSGRVRTHELLKQEIKTARGEEEALFNFRQRKADGGLINPWTTAFPGNNTNLNEDGDEIIPSSSISKYKKRIAGIINRHYGMTGVDLTKGLREIKMYSPEHMESISTANTAGFYQKESGVLGLKYGITDFEKTVIHEGYHGLDAYRGRFVGNQYGSQDPKDTKSKSVVDLIAQFVSGDISKVPNAKIKEYLSKREELLAFSAQQMLGDAGPGDTFNKYVPRDKREKLGRFAGRHITSLYRDLPGRMSDLPYQDWNHKPLINKINNTGLNLFKFADGGRSPQDVVPALLTPGEFVFSREAAEKIGYNRLNAMNSRGEVPGYNKGGRVELAGGTSGRGVMPALSSTGHVNQMGYPYNPWTTALNPNQPMVASSGVRTEEEMLAVLRAIRLQLNILGPIRDAIAGGGGGGSSSSSSSNQTQTNQDDMKNMLKMAAMTIVTAGASYLSDHLNTLAGTANNAALAGTGSNYIQQKSMAGGIQGGAIAGAGMYSTALGMGAAVAPFAIPLALGAAVLGGFAAYRSSQNAATAEMAGANLELAQRNLGDTTGIIGRRGTGFVTDAEAQSISQSIQRGFTSIREQAIAQNTTWYGSVNQGQANSAEETARRAFIQSQSAEFNRIITDYTGSMARDIGRQDLTPEQLRERLSANALRANLLGSNQADMFRTLAMQPGQSEESIAQRLSEQTIRQALNERAAVARQRSTTETERVYKEFDRLAEIVSKASSELEGLRIAAETTSALFEGRISGARFSFGGGGNIRFGVGDNVGAIGGISAGLGSQGETLRQSGMAYDTIRRNLFAALSSAFANGNRDNFDPQEFSIRIRESLTEAIGPALANTDAFRGILSNVSTNAQDAKFEDLRRLVTSGNVAGAADQLLRGSNIPQIFDKLKSEFEQFFNSLNSSFAELEKRHAQLDEILDKMSNNRILSLGIERQMPFLQAGINPANGQGALTVAERNAPFNDRLTRIAGEIGNPGGAITAEAFSNRFRQLNSEVIETQRQRDAAFSANPASTETFNLTRRLVELQRHSNEAGQALRELGDVAERVKSAQERLAQLNNEQANRAGLVQRLLTGGPAAQMQHAADMRMYQRLVASGRTMESLSPQTASRLIQTLSSINFPISQLPGSQNLIGPLTGRFGMNAREVGQLTGQDIANREMIRPAPDFVAPPAAQQERDALITQMQTHIAQAGIANQGLVDGLRTVNNKLSDDLMRIHSQFLARLELMLAQNRQENARGDLGAAQNELTTRQRQYATRRTLAGFGIMTQSQLANLGPIADLESLANSVNGTPSALRDFRSSRWIPNVSASTNTSGAFEQNWSFNAAPGAWGWDRSRFGGITETGSSNLIRAALQQYGVTNLSQENITELAQAYRAAPQPVVPDGSNQNQTSEIIGQHLRNFLANSDIFERILRRPDQQRIAQLAQAASTPGNQVTPAQVQALLQAIQGEAGRGLRQGIGEFNNDNRLEGAASRLTAAWNAFDAASAASTNLANAAQDAADRLGTLSGVPTARQSREMYNGVVSTAPALLGFGRNLLEGTPIGGMFGIGRNSGGPIPGSGNTDTVPAMLTPGEFVINAEAVKRIGVQNLHRLNAKRFNNGGLVDEAEALAREAATLDEVRAFQAIRAEDNILHAVAQIPEQIAPNEAILANALNANIQNRVAQQLGANNPNVLRGQGLVVNRFMPVRAGRYREQQRNVNEFMPARAGRYIPQARPPRAAIAFDHPVLSDEEMARRTRERERHNRFVELANSGLSIAQASVQARTEFSNTPRQEPVPIVVDPNHPQNRPLWGEAVAERRRLELWHRSNPNTAAPIGSIPDVHQIYNNLLQGERNAQERERDNRRPIISLPGHSGNTAFDWSDSRWRFNRPVGAGLREFGSGLLQPSAITNGTAFRNGNTPGLVPGRGFNSGGLVPGSGNFDSVPALVTPGEFVLNKAATAAAGVNNLQKFNNGGFVQNAYRSAMESSDSGPMVLAMQDFIQGLNPFINAMNAFPHELSGSFTHNVNVNINGADVFQNLEPAIREMVEATAAEQLSKYVSENLYQAGPVQ